MREGEGTAQTSIEGWHRTSDVRYVRAIAIMVTLAPMVLMAVAYALSPDHSLRTHLQVATFLVFIPLLYPIAAWMYVHNYRGLNADAGYTRNFFIEDTSKVFDAIKGGLPEAVMPRMTVTAVNKDDVSLSVSSVNVILKDVEGVIYGVFLNRNHLNRPINIEVITSDRASQGTRDLLVALNDIIEKHRKPWPSTDPMKARGDEGERVVKCWANLGWSFSTLLWNSYLGLISIFLMIAILVIIVTEPYGYEMWMLGISMLFVFTIQSLLAIASMVVEKAMKQRRADALVEYKSVYNHDPTYVTETIEDALTGKDRKFRRSAYVDHQNLLPCVRFELMDVVDARVYIDVSRRMATNDEEQTVVYIRTSRWVSDISWVQLIVTSAL